jgi:hypothetical protein
MSGWLMNDEIETISNEAVVANSWDKPKICLVGLRKTTRNLRQDITTTTSSSSSRKSGLVSLEMYC